VSDGTKIEWSEATWNIITGCSIKSPGCKRCYAMLLAGTRLSSHPSRAGLTKLVNGRHVWTGEVRFNGQWLEQPLRWKRPRRIFVCAHGDLFHELVPDVWIDRVFSIIAQCPQHEFQILTKRSERMRRYMDKLVDECLRWKRFGDAYASFVGNEAYDVGECVWPLPNVWLGVSIEDRARMEERAADLKASPAAVRWWSAEPLVDDLGEIDPELLPDWVVCGGESGRDARPMHPDWARSLRDQCEAAEVPYFFKQWGSWLPWSAEQPPYWEAQNGEEADGHTLFPDDIDHDAAWDDGLWAIGECSEHFAFQNVGQKRAGRLLDGKEHNAMPDGADA